MEETISSSDDEIIDGTLSPKSNGKKIKLNDGSSQESGQDTGSSSRVDENADSGVVIDNTERTSSEDSTGAPTETPNNEVVNAAPSSSNVHTILFNIRRPRRNYRKRKTPGRDSESDSSRDSDDLSMDESSSHSSVNQEREVPEIDLARMMAELSEDSVTTDGHSEESLNVDGDDSDDPRVRMHSPESADTNSSEGLWSYDDERKDDKEKMPSVLQKTRPKHSYLLLREIINREMGLTSPCGKAAKSDVKFEQDYYNSLHVVYRLKKLHQLNKHKGCVNSINFHPEGKLLASGSDDLNVVVWDWARNVPLQTLRTGHKSNVFQSKFLYLNARSQLNIVTCARDGQIRLLQCPPSGGPPTSRRKLGTHTRAAHKLHVTPTEPHSVISAGEDGACLHCDVREHQASRLFQVKVRERVVPLYSIQGHPLDNNKLMVAGRDPFVRVYDKRKADKPVALYCPNKFCDDTNGKRNRFSMMHLTCAVYNHDGGQILGSYNDEDIYLFDAAADVYDKESTKQGFSRQYSGHRNSATFKGVSFFGAQSRYVVSGSDCAHVFIWERDSEALLNCMVGDVGGVVNCIESHPRCPVLATSGLDRDVKIWVPRAHRDPDFNRVASAVRDNTGTHFRSPLFNDFLPTLYSAWRGENIGEGASPSPANIEFDGNACTAF